MKMGCRVGPESEVGGHWKLNRDGVNAGVGGGGPGREGK